MNSDSGEVELEEQFILRLPLKYAEKVREILETKPDKLKKTLKIDLDVIKCIGKVTFARTKLHAYLRKFPTIIESHKTNILSNKANLFKTADICHILECYEEPLDCFKKDITHGYTPPMKNAKVKRFRKTLVNPEVIEETELITKELYYLLSTDLEAVSTKFEIIYEESKLAKDQNSDEMENLFGSVTSSSDSDLEV